MNARFVFLLLLISLPIKPDSALGDDTPPTPLPDVGIVIQKMIERAGQNLTNQHTAVMSYYRTNVTEEYNGRGDVKERNEYVKQIILRPGNRASELIRYNGKPPTEKEIERHAKKDGRRRAGNNDQDLPNRSEQMDAYMTENILDRFTFTVHGRDVVEDRPCLVVGFKPGATESKSTSMFDRVIDQMGGIIWVDEDEYEMVKADIQLREKVKMWGGILASLDQIRLKIERTRDDEGFWYDRTVSAHFVGRALARHIDVMTWDFTSKPAPLDTPEKEDSVGAAQ